MFGIGLRPAHYPFLEDRPHTQLDWFEAISENYMGTSGRPILMLETIRKDYPVALHGVGLSIASSESLNDRYLSQLKALIKRIDPFIVSDHLCWTGTSSHQLHDLLPFPMNDESLQHVEKKIHQVQDILQRPLVLENVSSYVTFQNSDYQEWEFLNALVKRTGCKILLDVNNVYVNAQNHGFSPREFLENIDCHAVAQIHLAGHIDTGDYLFDTHSRPVCDEVWSMYFEVASKFSSHIPTLIEWDADIPSFQEVEAQAMRAKHLWNQAHADQLTSPSTSVCGSSDHKHPSTLLSRYSSTDRIFETP